jgi:O-methyltransferase
METQTYPLTEIPPTATELNLNLTISALLEENPNARIGFWGLIGLGERIINMSEGLKHKLVWIADRNPLLHGQQISCSNLTISSPASLGLAGIDVLILGVRDEFVDEVISEASKGLRHNATIVSIQGVHTVIQNQYEGATPVATYSPWNTDLAFQSYYAEISNNTLVDKLRCYELWQLIEQSAKLTKGSLLEVGVWKGGTAALIAKKATMCGILDPVFLCDTFKGVVKAGKHDSIYKGGEHQDTSATEVDHILCRLNIQNYRILDGVFPEDTGTNIENLRFRFCHIDVDVYNSAKDVAEWIWPRLVNGGIVVFDDYGFQSCNGVTTFVNEMRLWPHCLIVHNLNGHAIAIKY